jgi:hypothetical protein
MKLITVDFSGGGEGITALYIDGVLYKYGDYYHDKISDWIRGFIEGVKYGCNEEVEEELIGLDPENPWLEETWELAGLPPKKFEDLYKPVPKR